MWAGSRAPGHSLSYWHTRVASGISRVLVRTLSIFALETVLSLRTMTMASPLASMAMSGGEEDKAEESRRCAGSGVWVLEKGSGEAMQ